MDRIDNVELLKDASSLKVTVLDSEIEYFVGEVNNFKQKRPDVDFLGIEPMRYVNAEVINVFSTEETVLVDAEVLMKNVHDREGNYIKIPKVLK